jgi:hypothetical protein
MIENILQALESGALPVLSMYGVINAVGYYGTKHRLQGPENPMDVVKKILTKRKDTEEFCYSFLGKTWGRLYKFSEFLCCQGENLAIRRFGI